MIECSQCGKELEREVFCSPKCKMRWHRKAPIKKTARKTHEAKVSKTKVVVPGGPKHDVEIVPNKCLLHGEHPQSYCSACNDV